MSCTDFQADSIGVKIRLSVTECDGSTPFDLTDTVTQEIVFRLGALPAVTKTASIEGSPTAGVLYYVTVDGDFATAGAWKAQARLVLSSGSEFRSREVSFKVRANL